MKHVVLGTAGHIDHGKTTLIKALTGIDTDRLKEEQERGITIDIGFAHLDLEDGTQVGIVDVPGHERFVRNMLAGAGGIDLVALVVAADEGVMPQTREHLEICSLLGIRHGLVALTKIDMVEEDWLELVQEDLRAQLMGTFLAGAPIVPVSGVTGQGLEEFRQEIARVLEGVSERPDDGTFRLPVDRVFSIRGFGTVVTGTVVSGRTHLGDHLWLRPEGLKVKIRGIEVHDQKVDSAGPGRRTALNLQGVERSKIQRGDMVVGTPLLEPTHLLDVRLEVLPSAPRPLKHRSRHRLHAWSSESFVQLALPDGRELAPGQSALVQLRLNEPVTVLPGDRFVIRELSPAVTVAGGRVLGVAGSPMRRRDRHWPEQTARLESPEMTEAAQAALERAGLLGLTVRELAVSVIGADRTPDLADRLVSQGRALRFPEADDRLVDARGITRLRAALLEEVDSFHRRWPLRLGSSREELRSRLAQEMDPRIFARLIGELCTDGRLETRGGLLLRPGYRPELTPEQQAATEAILAAFREGGFRPPLPSEVLAQHGPDGAGLYRYLVDQEELVKVSETVVFPRERYQEIRDGLRGALEEREAVDMSVFKELFGLSRKYAVPLLEHFDAVGLTRREGDRRVLR